MPLRRIRKQLKNEIIKVEEHTTSDDTAIIKKQEIDAVNINPETKPSDSPTATAASNNQQEHPDGANKNMESELADPLASTSTVDTNSNKVIKCIRRKRNPDGWKQNIRKKLRQAGKEYVNASGQVIAGRGLKPACGSTCHLKCAERFSEEQRQTIHNTFWRLTDEQKNNFYWKYTSRCEPKRRCASSATLKRANTFRYRFEVRGELMPVCSKYFFNTLDITSRRIYYFYEHCYQEDICMPREMKRGKNPKPDLPNLGERLDEIREHISSFPSVRLSGSSKKRYLDADLNLTRLYEMYTKIATNPLKSHWYYRVFNDEFNLGFRLPSKKVHHVKKIGAKDKVKVEIDLSLPLKIEKAVSIATMPDNPTTIEDTTQWREEPTAASITMHPIQTEQPGPLPWNGNNMPLPMIPNQYTNYGWNQEY